MGYIIFFMKAGTASFCAMWHFTGHIQVTTLMRGKAHKPKVSSRAWFCKGQRIVNYILLDAVMFLPTWNYRPFYWMNNNSSEINLIWLRHWKWSFPIKYELFKTPWSYSCLIWMSNAKKIRSNILKINFTFLEISLGANQIWVCILLVLPIPMTTWYASGKTWHI